MNSDNDKRIVKQFCKFCTQLLKNEIRDIYRKENKGQKYKKYLTVFRIDDTDEIGTYDNYFKDENTFDINGDTVIVADNRIANAIRQIPKNKQDIIILSYFVELSDNEIGKRLNLTQQSVSKRHKQALRLLKKLLNKEDFNYD